MTAARTRTLLIVVGNEEGVFPFRGDALDAAKPLCDAVRLPLVALALQRGRPNPHPEMREYLLYSWSLAALDHDQLVASVPKPGIVMAVKRSFSDTSVGPWSLKHLLLSTERVDIRQFLDPFIQGPDSQYEPASETAYDVFVSYSTADEALAFRLFNSLEGRGLRCFFSPRSITAGKPWEKELSDAIHASKMAIVVLTPSSISSNWAMAEVGAFWAAQKPVIGALWNINAKDLPGPMAKYQSRNIETDAGLHRLCDEIRTMCQG